MKRHLIFYAFIVIAFTACNTPRYAGVNDMNAQPATVYFKDTAMAGQLSIGTKQFSFSNVKYIQFAEGASKEYKYYHPKDIIGFSFNGSYYIGKYLSADAAFFTPENKTFVKLLTEKSSKIKMYEYTAITTVKNSQGVSSTKSTRSNYVELPNTSDDVIYNFTSNKFTPNFDDKVSALLANAPALAEKIKSKNKQVFYGWLSNDDIRLQVWWNIINEYNSVKN